MTFDAVTDWGRDGDVWRGEVPRDWLQGRTAFGGLPVAAGVRALDALVDPDRTLRAVSVAFVGPTGSGSIEARPTVLRSGGSVTHGRVDVVGSEGVVCAIGATYGRARGSRVRTAPRPALDVPGPDGLVAMPYIEGVVPRFVQHFDLRWTHGSYPFSGAHALEHAGWCRHRTDPGPPHAAILGLLDAWPAPALQVLSRPAPASSVTWSAAFATVPERVTADDWFWFRCAVVHAAGDGFLTMRGELHDARGGLVAHAEQLVALYDGPPDRRADDA